MNSSVFDLSLEEKETDLLTYRLHQIEMGEIHFKVDEFNNCLCSREQDIIDYIASILLNNTIDNFYVGYKTIDDKNQDYENEVFSFLKRFDNSYYLMLKYALLNKELLVRNYDGCNSYFLHDDDMLPDLILLSRNNFERMNVDFVHEIGHFFDFKMTNYAFLDSNLLGEVHSILLELLFIDYMIFEKHDFTYYVCYIERKFEIENDARTLKYMIELSKLHCIGKLNSKAIDYLYRKFINAKEYDHDVIMHDTIKFNYKKSFKYLVSYLIALILKEEYKNNCNNVKKILKMILIYNDKINNIYDLRKIGIDMINKKTIDYVIGLHTRKDKIK